MKYYEEIPIIRSIAAILVVSVHVTAGIYYSNQVFSNEFIGYINQIARLGTPVFAVVSAFLLTSSVLRRGFNFHYFFKSRFTKIFLPYIIWSSIYLIYRGSIEHSLNKDLSIVSYFVYGNANFHLYFILTVIQFYFLFPILQKLKKVYF
nr:acyltransferase family protein [Exiguobacterium sp. s80]